MTLLPRARPALGFAGVVLLAACGRGPAPSTRPGVRAGDAATSVIRVLVADNPVMRISAVGDFAMLDRSGRVLTTGGPSEPWRVESEVGRVRALGPNGRSTPWVATLVMRSERGAPLSVSARSYRGQMAFYGNERGVEAVNWVAIDDYLPSVVASEMGERPATDFAALQAQAVAARSYAFTRLMEGSSRNYDVMAGVADQAYGGVAVENPLAVRAVESTRGLVLKYGGRVVNAPYHSTCGGSTAEWSELFRGPDEPYLQAVSDRVPHSDRFYCDLSPRFQWTKTLDGAALNAALADYLSTIVAGAPRAPGVARSVGVTGRTRSGRAGGIVVTTDRGSWAIRGNDIRNLLRVPGGEILNSTYFSVENSTDSEGRLVRLTLRGMGYGHGVGMCQWGAIGRARAGQDFRAILRTYYPGTSVGRS